MMIQFYLLTNAFLYLLFTVWCLIKNETSARFLGYGFINNTGKVEYLTIYTGLQLGFTVFLSIAAFKEEMRFTALVFLVCLYLGIMLTRTSAAVYFGHLDKATYWVGGLEYALGIWGLVLLIIKSQ